MHRLSAITSRAAAACLRRPGALYRVNARAFSQQGDCASIGTGRRVQPGVDAQRDPVKMMEYVEMEFANSSSSGAQTAVYYSLL